MRLKTKFSLLISLLVIIIISGVSVSFIISESRFLVREFENSRAGMVKSLAQAAKESLIVKDEIILLNYLKLIKNTKGLAYAMVTDGTGRILAHTDINLLGAVPGDEVSKKAFAASDYTVIKYKGGDGRDLLDLSMPVVVSEDRQGTVRLGFYQELINKEVEDALSGARKRIMLVSAAALLCGLLGAFVLTAMMTKPIKILAQGAGIIGQGKLDHKISVETKDELGDLAAEFNKMSEKLKELDQMKSDFVSSVTHELRSPLLSLKLYIDLFFKGTAGAINDKQKEYLEIMKNCALRLSRFIDDLLDVAKIERGKMEVSLQTLDLLGVITETIQLFKPQFDEKHIVFTSEAPEKLPPALGDPDRTRQVLINLLSNAVKFTPQEGAISVGAGYDEKQKLIFVSVRDSGIGIPSDKLDKIFDKFEQIIGTQGKNPKPKGTGLGLAIVKGIMESMGGRVSVESELGKGSKFTFSLPPA
ncbi:MAG TPA: hypothetical protein DEE98_07435 [Elusimicrobia bacterium]|nr:MAG: hypothetical protein A2278_04125 [Elusimicrobia bacterium RIFOXYA12_FULL_49_49]OGS10835.1 MAG: hypothetical protein A2386_03350 [Elusimicrobia bacterium RIFOXYB1_FULL_48_9]OGS15099.1 MAG: hypothetical protein A2251_00295 [Elusimicrobia bacterium RIFOXYA2_FULL_47_53]OGS27106.1 MAG: hypothetical protein A2339_05030 [Elusimicrobia bacterium RIFOXYB12_FULL_50_12]OGS29719.1 MAG: hypothetical protein A2323_01095 [Elusimicrobia bacterium RIFOXYB2_FULL_46_23]HBU70195.1 hypothetical protein [El